MKTTLNTITCIGLFFLMISFPAFSQTTKQFPVFGLNFNHYVTGNGHGSMYNPEVQLRLNKSSVSMGPTIQKYTRQMNGFRLTYAYSVAGSPYRTLNEKNEKSLQFDCDMEMYFFVSAHYLHSATLTSKTLMAEDMENRNLNITYNTGEIFAGIGFNRHIWDRFNLRLFVGLGQYMHYNYSQSLFHPSKGTMLLTGIGIGVLK